MLYLIIKVAASQFWETASDPRSSLKLWLILFEFAHNYLTKETVTNALAYY